MSNDDRLTPQERDVIEAAVEFSVPGSTLHSMDALRRAVDAYEASLRPQPVECLMSRRESNLNPDGWSVPLPLDTPLEEFVTPEVWRVTITPIERVR